MFWLILFNLLIWLLVYLIITGIRIYQPNTHPLSVTQGQLSSTQFGLVSFSERDFSETCVPVRSARESPPLRKIICC